MAFFSGSMSESRTFARPGVIGRSPENGMKRFGLLCTLLTLVACSSFAAETQVPPPSAAPVPAGTYTLDKAHGSLIFRVNHLGFSHYTARFKRFDATLQFDPDHLARSSVTATVDATSLETDYPNPKELDFNAQLQGEQWLDTAKFPQMTFRSKTIEVTGPNEFRINGELTLRGITRPMTLEAKYNGGYAGHPLDPHARIGFSAHGTLKRSEFGMTYGIPAPGTTMGVGDEVEIIIEAEFTGPPLKTAGTS
jgi:polyisoprenoid-binding protein YceI